MKNTQREGSREKKLCSVCACVSAQGEWVRQDKGKMLNSLSEQPAHSKDSLKQNGHYFWKQDRWEGGLLFQCGKEVEEETGGKKEEEEENV